MDNILEILKLAEKNELPERIGKDSIISIDLIKELVNSGYLDAIDASSFDGASFIKPKITLEGREYLLELENNLKKNTILVKLTNLSMPIVKWVFGIAATVIAAWLILNYVNKQPANNLVTQNQVSIKIQDGHECETSKECNSGKCSLGPENRNYCLSRLRDCPLPGFEGVNIGEKYNFNGITYLCGKDSVLTAINE